jgi:hypothetical protein
VVAGVQCSGFGAPMKHLIPWGRKTNRQPAQFREARRHRSKSKYTEAALNTTKYANLRLADYTPISPLHTPVCLRQLCNTDRVLMLMWRHYCSRILIEEAAQLRYKE